MKYTASMAFKNVTALINKGQERSVKAKKNILGTFLIKGISIAISLVLVPITINYINPGRYGIWLTISSVVGWFSFFDIGLTQGLRNKFAEAKANNQVDLAKIYVSTTYAILTLICGAIWIVFLICNHFLNWSNILKTPVEMQSEISVLALIVFTYFCLQFVLKIITTLIIADQQPAKASLIDLFGQILSLIIIIVLVKTTEGSLVKLGFALCISPLIVLLGANIFFFKGILKKYSPSLSSIKFSSAKGLFNLGIIFFVIQIAGVVQYETANVIIARNFGTASVTSYNIAYKYFGMLNMIFAIFLVPFWSASTEAYLKEDLDWIKNGMKKYNLLNILLGVLGICMLIFSERIYALWLGKGTVNIGISLSFWSFLYFNVVIFSSKYVSFLNGISALRIQFLSSVISPFVYILVALILIKFYKMGVNSLFIAAIIANFNGFLLAPLQYHQVVYKQKKGIWVK